MGKPKQERRLADTEAEAIARNLRVSPRKLNLVAGLIRNQDAGAAVATLTFSKRRIAIAVRKALESAIANAENNHQLDVDRLFVARAEVGRAVVMRRFQARGKGRAARVEKWFSHLRIVVAEREEAEEVETPRPASRAAVRNAGRGRRVPAENIAAENAPPPPTVAVPDVVSAEGAV
jgi:large subunit ribosomal protein L22